METKIKKAYPMFNKKALFLLLVFSLINILLYSKDIYGHRNHILPKLNSTVPYRLLKNINIYEVAESVKNPFDLTPKEKAKSRRGVLPKGTVVCILDQPDNGDHNRYFRVQIPKQGLGLIYGGWHGEYLIPTQYGQCDNGTYLDNTKMQRHQNPLVVERFHNDSKIYQTLSTLNLRESSPLTSNYIPKIQTVLRNRISVRILREEVDSEGNFPWFLVETQDGVGWIYGGWRGANLFPLN